MESEEDRKRKLQSDNERRKKERGLKMMQNLEEVKSTAANGGITNAEKMMEEQKEGIAKA